MFYPKFSLFVFTSFSKPFETIHQISNSKYSNDPFEYHARNEKLENAPPSTKFTATHAMTIQQLPIN